MITSKIERFANLKNLNIPTECPVCRGDLLINENGFIECLNLDCSQKHIHKFNCFFAGLSVDGAGDSFTSALVQECGIKSIAMLLRVKDENPNIYVTAAGGINGDKIVKNLNGALKRPISLGKFLSLFDLKGFAEKKLSALERLNLFSDFYSYPAEALRALALMPVDSFVALEMEGVVSPEVKEGLFLEIQKKLEDMIESVPFFNVAKEELELASRRLEGMSFCFTGKAERSRKELESMTVAHGGSVSAVKKGLTALVTDDTESGSSKNKKARELGIPIMTSREFIDLCEK
ncbi:MAG: hypothetical protein HUK21_01005 [Fibrobacteraceae bacterium]|nr:hypothetical protein [Fibrobacteraceae bacterium]